MGLRGVHGALLAAQPNSAVGALLSATGLSHAGFRVCVVDPAPLASWPNNYGVWADEFEAMGLEDCLEVVWPQAQVHLDSGAQFGSRCDAASTDLPA